MASCSQECFRVVTHWESYTVDGPISSGIALGADPATGVPPACPPLSDRVAEEWVARFVEAGRYAVEEPACPEGCTCKKYETPPPPRRLAPENEKKCIQVVIPNSVGFCLYVVCFTVHSQSTVFPVGICRPNGLARPRRAIPLPPDLEPVVHPRVVDIPGEGIAPPRGPDDPGH